MRKSINRSQEQLALDAGVERNYISLIERGINQPTIKILFKLAKALGTRPATLVEMTEQEMGTEPDVSGQ